MTHLCSLFRLRFPFLVGILRMCCLLGGIVRGLPAGGLECRRGGVMFCGLVECPVSGFQGFGEYCGSQVRSLYLVVGGFRRSCVGVDGVSVGAGGGC